MTGLCQCGCGQPAPIAKASIQKRGHVRGQPLRFIHSHNSRGANNSNWRGGWSTDTRYIYRKPEAGERPNGRGYVREHVAIVERALGKPLPKGAQVHHVNEIKTDNRPSNLVVCQDQAYHALLHQRAAALKACGQPDWRKCKFCKRWDSPGNLYIRKGNGSSHVRCATEYSHARRSA